MFAAAEYVRRFHDLDWADPTHYHLTLNTSLLGDARMVEIIVDAARHLEESSNG